MEHAIRIAAALAVAATFTTVWAHGNGWITLDGRQLGALVIIAAAATAACLGARALTTVARRF